jgi:hypothetical protein
MKYIDTYKFLNSHLHAVKETSGTTPSGVYTVRRNPPNLLRFQQETQAILKNNFGFTDALFQTHEVHYPSHTIRRTPHGFGRFSIIDVQTQWGNTYFHFLTEVLPSVLQIANSSAPICCYYAPFVIPFFRWFGVQNNIIFEMPAYRKETIDQPYIECGNPSLQKIQLLRSVVESKSRMNPSIGILMYRQEPTRKILNHDETLAMLKTKYPDVEWVVFDKLSPAETATLFSNAKIIVGPHGAGFTNMIFAPKGIHVVEFISMEAPNVCYWHMSEMIGNHHLMVPCYTKDTQFTIDTEEVLRLLPSI